MTRRPGVIDAHDEIKEEYMKIAVITGGNRGVGKSRPSMWQSAAWALS
jgi:hypothetical protein